MKRFLDLVCNTCFITAIIIIALSLFGCSTRENAKAQKQADQSLEASVTILKTMDDVYADLSSEEAQLFKDKTKYVIELITLARGSIAPALGILGDEPVDTTVDEAIYSPETFKAKVIRQTIKAEIETEEYSSVRNTFFSWARSIDPTDLLLGSGLGGLLLGGLKLAQVYMRERKVSAALAEGNQRLKTADDKEVEKDKLKTEQKKAGIHKYVKAKLDTAKET